MFELILYLLFVCVFNAHASNAAVSSIVMHQMSVHSCVTVLKGNAMTTLGFEDFGHSIFPVFPFESNLPFPFP